jgi:hypothetical protein
MADEEVGYFYVTPASYLMVFFAERPNPNGHPRPAGLPHPNLIA